MSGVGVPDHVRWSGERDPERTTRPACVEDAAAILRIYAQGIEDRTGTFEVDVPSLGQVQGWFGEHPTAVADVGGVVAFASSYGYRQRPAFRTVAEFRVYVARELRGVGFGKAVVSQLCRQAVENGYHKLVSRVFPENAAARRMLVACGFREVGAYTSHARLDGRWRDVIIVEKVFPENL